MKRSIQMEIPVVLIYLVLGAMFVFYLHFTAGCLTDCVETVIYTVPAAAPDDVDISISTYIRQTGLFRHLQGMPTSAKWFFAWNCIGFIVLIAVESFIVFLGIRVHRKASEENRNRMEVMDETENNVAVCISAYKRETKIVNGIPIVIGEEIPLKGQNKDKQNEKEKKDGRSKSTQKQ